MNEIEDNEVLIILKSNLKRGLWNKKFIGECTVVKHTFEFLWI